MLVMLIVKVKHSVLKSIRVVDDYDAYNFSDSDSDDTYSNCDSHGSFTSDEDVVINYFGTDWIDIHTDDNYVIKYDTSVLLQDVYIVTSVNGSKYTDIHDNKCDKLLDRIKIARNKEELYSIVIENFDRIHNLPEEEIKTLSKTKYMCKLCKDKTTESECIKNIHKRLDRIIHAKSTYNKNIIKFSSSYDHEYEVMVIHHYRV